MTIPKVTFRIGPSWPPQLADDMTVEPSLGANQTTIVVSDKGIRLRSEHLLSGLTGQLLVSVDGTGVDWRLNPLDAFWVDVASAPEPESAPICREDMELKLIQGNAGKILTWDSLYVRSAPGRSVRAVISLGEIAWRLEDWPGHLATPRDLRDAVAAAKSAGSRLDGWRAEEKT